MSRTIRINGPGSVFGDLLVPGDKSLSHRVAMLASVARGASVITGFASSRDCSATLECVQRLGIEVERKGREIIIHGRGLRGYAPGDAKVLLDAGNSGSTIRMLSGLLAAQRFTSVVDGDASLRRRPMARIIEPLAMMGCRIDAGEGNCAPLTIRGGLLKAISYSSRIASAQVKSCVLFAGLYAEGKTIFKEPFRSRNHTELMLPAFGIEVETYVDESDSIVSLEGGRELESVRYNVPGDISSAAFFIAAATALPGSNLAIGGVGLNPTRAAFIEVLNGLGAYIRLENVIEHHGEPVGDLIVSGSRLVGEAGGTILSGEIIPNIIDEVPILAVIGTQVEGRIEVRGAKELRVKESDRIRTVVDGIRALGGEIEEFEDGFAVGGPQRLKGSRIETAGDHRIAMAFSIAGLIAEGETEIIDADCASVSFPEFYELLAQVSGSAGESKDVMEL